jgi:1-acyl-sn-glycerol-3-phosphate acyltransferase
MGFPALPLSYLPTLLIESYLSASICVPMPDFYPPKQNPLLVRLCQSVAPLVAWGKYRMRLKMSQESMERLAALRDRRLLLLPNHPTHHDWIAVFMLSARFGGLFHFLAAYERFGGKGGAFLQQMGVYSVRRGLGDRASVAQTIEILSQPQCRLVIFPEGGYSFQNDTVMPFRTGPVQIALQTVNRLIKRGESPDLYAVPLSLKYCYTENMAPAIRGTLSRLERTLKITPAQTDYDRLLNLADAVLTKFEGEYGLPSMEEPLTKDDYPFREQRSKRLNRIRTYLLDTCGQKLGISSPPNTPLRERVYKIQYALDAQAESLTEGDFWNYDMIQTAAARLLNFDAIYDGYVAENPTPERFLDTLTRLERAVFGIDQPLPKGDRQVIIQVGEPVNLGEWGDRYLKDKSNTVNSLTEQLHQAVQSGLDEINRNLHKRN